MILEHRYNLFGYRFLLRTNLTRAAELFAALYAGRIDTSTEAPAGVYELLHDPGKPGGECWTIAVPGLASHPKPTLGDCLSSVEACISGDLTRHNHGLFVVHGAVVYAPEGDVLLSGHSGAGKTTLSLALASCGLRVGGDDMALLDPVTGVLQPHPRCFHIDDRSAAMLAGLGLRLPAEALRDQFVTPRNLGLTLLPPAQPRFLFLLEAERRDAPCILPETQAHAASALLLQTGRGHFSDLEAVKAVARMVGGARCFRLWSGELGATARAVLNIARQGASW